MHHAIHPNYLEKADPVNRPHINAGIAVKYNANQKYCTDGISAAMFKELCKEAGVSCQVLRESFGRSRRLHSGKYFQYAGGFKYSRYWTAAAGYAFSL